jgi:ElaB/YqjD/DUF883 family membrane-anchored ribosome-binding protein
MPAETMTDTAAEAAAAAKRVAKDAVATAVESGQKSFNDALDVAERGLNEAAKRLEKVMREGVDRLRTQTQPYRDNAGQQFDDAQKYVLERVKERPVTATLAGLGVGLLLGLLLANRSSR